MNREIVVVMYEHPCTKCYECGKSDVEFIGLFLNESDATLCVNAKIDHNGYVKENFTYDTQIVHHQ